MHPVLLNIGALSISSFGFFLSLAFLVSVFTIWRICRVYDINEERILDVSLLTFFGGLIGARIYYVVANFSQFDSLSKIILINKYPGLTFWGGLIGGSLALYFLAKHFKINFWQLGDFIIVGIFAGLIFGSFGCLLGSCQSGYVTSGPLSVSQIGLIGSRFPVQFFEALLFLFGFLYLWKMAIKFHFNGKIAAVGLITLGIFKFLAEFWRGDTVKTVGFLTTGHIWAILAFVTGLVIYYKQSKRSFILDIKYLFSSRFRRVTLPKLIKTCYNLMINWRMSIRQSFKNARIRSKGILKNINVKSQPPKLQ